MKSYTDFATDFAMIVQDKISEADRDLGNRTIIFQEPKSDPQVIPQLLDADFEYCLDELDFMVSSEYEKEIGEKFNGVVIENNTVATLVAEYDSEEYDIAAVWVATTNKFSSIKSQIRQIAASPNIKSDTVLAVSFKEDEDTVEEDNDFIQREFVQNGLKCYIEKKYINDSNLLFWSYFIVKNKTSKGKRKLDEPQSPRKKAKTMEPKEPQPTEEQIRLWEAQIEQLELKVERLYDAINIKLNRAGIF